MPHFDRLTRAVAARLNGGGSVPLLAVRIPVLEAIAWREGRRAAHAAERRAVNGLRAAGVLRAGDAFAHRSGSDRFAVALLAPARNGGRSEAPDPRRALRRIAEAAARSTGHRVQSGWCTLRRRDDLDFLGATIDAALEGGLRDRERREMLATFGHELRTPLSAIGGYLETLLEGALDAQTARRFLQTAQRETLRLGRIADGLMAFSMLDVPASLDVPAANGAACCEVAAVVAECFEAIAPLAVSRHIRMRARVRGAAGARIEADACAQALLNLLDNALKWATSRVDVICWSNGGAVTIAVDDDGPGIAVDQRERIFEFGVRADGSRRSGAGIGLAIVRTLARRSGGEAAATSSPLGGARFVMRLVPVASPPARGRPPKSNAAAP